MERSKNDSGESGRMNRRQLLKASGLASAIFGGVGLGFFGYEAGRDPRTYTGNESYQGTSQSFDRKAYAAEKPHYEKVGPTRRPDARSEVIFQRVGRLRNQWDEEKGLDGLDEVLRSYYEQNPDDLEEDLYGMREILPKFRQATEEYGRQFLLAEAWSNAMSEVWPDSLDAPPEETDFPKGMRFGEPTEPLKMKSLAKTSKLIKQMAHQLGATLVGITKLNPDWVYKYPMRRRGFELEKPVEIPEHWEYAVVVGTPMSWDPMYANPNYGTSHDAYSKTRLVAYRVAKFIRQLGYAARPNTPGADYDLMVPPVVIDAGLGEQGRHGVVVTPELGSNFRPAVVATNLPVETDKPIDFGVQDFCKNCMICAENCPSGAITFGDKVEVRGYLRYKINPAKCYNFWFSNLGNLGCRICVAVCPYTRKSNWIHKTALKVTANDPTGISHGLLTEAQKRFYPAPDPQDYYLPSMGGENASYREPPWWLKTEDFIDL